VRRIYPSNRHISLCMKLKLLVLYFIYLTALFVFIYFYIYFFISLYLIHNTFSKNQNHFCREFEKYKTITQIISVFFVPSTLGIPDYKEICLSVSNIKVLKVIGLTGCLKKWVLWFIGYLRALLFFLPRLNGQENLPVGN